MILISSVGLAVAVVSVVVVRPMLQRFGGAGAGPVRAACESYRYAMHEHNELNPLLSVRAGAQLRERYRVWLRQGVALNRRLFEAVGLADPAEVASGRSQISLSSGIIDAASRCYFVGVDFGGYEADRDYEEGIGTSADSGGDSNGYLAVTHRP